MTKKVVALVVLLVILAGLAVAYFVGGEDLMGRMMRIGPKTRVTVSDDITRGELMRYLVVYPGWEIVDGGPTFSDVPTSHTYYKYIETVAAHGFIDGKSDGTFGPENNVSRAEAAKLYVEAFELPICLAAYNTSNYNDVSEDSWYFVYIETLVHNGMSELMGSGNFNPDKNITKTDAIAWGKFLKDVDYPSECTTVDVIVPYEDVCPEVVLAANTPSGYETPSSNSTVLKFDVSAPAGTDVSVNELVLYCDSDLLDVNQIVHMTVSANGDDVVDSNVDCSGGVTMYLLDDDVVHIAGGETTSFSVYYDTLNFDMAGAVDEHLLFTLDEVKGDNLDTDAPWSSTECGFTPLNGMVLVY